VTTRAERLTDESTGQWHHHVLTASNSAALLAEMRLRADPPY
jgi:hypothetical protein